MEGLKRLLCTLFGHRWRITHHVVPIMGKFVRRDEKHPLKSIRIGRYGYAEDGFVRDSEVLQPLAGCRAECERCTSRVDDIIKGEETTVIEERMVLVSRRSV